MDEPGGDSTCAGAPTGMAYPLSEYQLRLGIA